MSLEDNERLIYLTYERTFGVLLSLGAYVSLVRYEKDGNVYEVYIENNEFEELGGIGYDDDIE